MSRRRRVIHKEVRKDARYASPVVARLISTVMRRGKKSIAEQIVYTAIDKSREGTDTVDPLETLNKAIENVKPRLEVKSRRVGGATYQVPMEVPSDRQVALAMRWIVGGKAAQGRAASPSQMGRFETQWLIAEKNLLALADLSGQWIDIVHGRRPPKGHRA